ncbi:hypothetical protein AA313_de0204420 [Arthrobotrys entomopaga]|nr:hypothetical protein AA313_de0204420 [Arthrobotrys entomopaga]
MGAQDLDLSIYICKPHQPNNGRHWLLMTSYPSAPTGTWYHVTGGPTQNRPYTLEIQAGKRTDSRGIDKAYKVGKISPRDVNKLKAAVQGVNDQQNCQRFVVAVVEKLEKKGLVRQGMAEYWSKQYKKSPWEVDNGVEAGSETRLRGHGFQYGGRA